MSADYPSFRSLLGDDYDGVYQADNLYLSDCHQTMIHYYTNYNNNYSYNDFLLSATSTFPGSELKQDSNSSSWINDIHSLQDDDLSLYDDNHQQTLLQPAADKELAAKAKPNNVKNEGGKKRRQRKNIIKEDYDQADNSKKAISSKAEEGCVVYVRAKRGQATDTHSLAERVRRQLISDKMKLLQSLVPGCDKMVGKRLILDEIINYIHSLQTHVQFLKTSLALIDPIFSLNNHSLDSLTIHQQDPAYYASLQCSTVPRECSSLHDEIRYDSIAPSSSTALTSASLLTVLQEYGHYNSMLQN